MYCNLKVLCKEKKKKKKERKDRKVTNRKEKNKLGEKDEQVWLTIVKPNSKERKKERKEGRKELGKKEFGK